MPTGKRKLKQIDFNKKPNKPVLQIKRRSEKYSDRLFKK
jgi:hypothetical protein